MAAMATTPAIAQDTRRSEKDRPAVEAFTYCLNTSTIRGQGLGLVAEVELAAKAGYQAIEPWLGELDKYAKEGGSLPDLRKRIADRGLKVASAIGFAGWIVDDDAQRTKGLDQAKRDMELVRALGGTRIAAPPAGATDKTVALPDAARRYRALLELGERIGVTPQVEVWGFSKSLSRLAETVYVAVESGHPAACVLPDVYHLHKGGSGFDTLKLLSGVAVQVFHVRTTTRPCRSGRRSTTRTASTRATAWPRYGRSSATSGPPASAAPCRWSSSTATTGERTPNPSPAPAWPKCGRWLRKRSRRRQVTRRVSEGEAAHTVSS
jgi:sugar phosphate isomerase/epimerase